MKSQRSFDANLAFFVQFIKNSTYNVDNQMKVFSTEIPNISLHLFQLESFKELPKI